MFAQQTNPMPALPASTSLRLPAPRGFRLARDVCSYGYFLLAPNYWDTRTHVLWRAVHLGERAVLVCVRQPRVGQPLVVSIPGVALRRAERDTLRQQLSRMLRLDETARTLAPYHAHDDAARRTGRGRLFRSPTFFEDVIKTVTSCNVQWPGTIRMNQRLCEVVGERCPLPSGRAALAGVPVAHAFPTPAQLARVRPASLRARCRVGYRDARIVELARLFTLAPSRGGIDTVWFESPSTPDDSLWEALLDLPGIGPYAAANIMQLLGRYARLPLDTESVRHGRAVLGYKGTSAQVMKAVHRHYQPFGDQAFRAYWFELWDFYEQRRGPAHTWDRETTGKTFTAALLNEARP